VKGEGARTGGAAKLQASARDQAAATVQLVLCDQPLRERFERQTRPLLAVLYRAARRLSAQPADAEDLVHDTYVKAFQAFPTVELGDDAACRAWLFGIMTNIYRDRYRRQARCPEVVRSDELDRLGSAAACPEPGPDRRLESKRFAEAADAAIASLPPEVRCVVALFLIGELSYREIAEITQCPTGTVMSQLWRGRRLLRQALRAYRDHEPSELSSEAASSSRRHGP
jgi:RNA polymerase sigma-70 factor (ECF subfamily)